MTHDFPWINKNNLISLLDSDSETYVSRKRCFFQPNFVEPRANAAQVLAVAA